jgi:hypothetical protein
VKLPRGNVAGTDQDGHACRPSPGGLACASNDARRWSSSSPYGRRRATRSARAATEKHRPNSTG